MSGVDVLARIAAAWGEDSPEYAAVAELIEASAGVEGLARLNAAPLRAYVAAVNRLTEALARVGGAA